jgi:Na+/proline symporter
MGIVLNQSLKNTIITYIGFGIGAKYNLFISFFLGATYYNNYVLSASSIIMPLLAFGMQNTLVKFYSQCKTEQEQSQFLSFTVLFPLLLSIPLILIGYFFIQVFLLSCRGEPDS